MKKMSDWLEKQKRPLDKASKSELLDYLAHTVRSGVSVRSSARQLSSLRRFYRYLVREGIAESDPTSDLESPVIGKTLPKTLSESSVEQLLAAPAENTALGIRDRAMLETIYATGLRVSELVNLTLSGLDAAAGLVRVTGKGAQEENQQGKHGQSQQKYTNLKVGCLRISGNLDMVVICAFVSVHC